MKNIVIWVFVGIFFIFTWILFSVSTAQAQSTMKFKIFNNVVKAEVMPFPDEQVHFMGVLSREGVALFENGEVGTQSAVLGFDTRGNTVNFDAVTTIIFPDASSWVFKTKGTGEMTPDRKVLTTQQTGDFVKGTGKYEGIKGRVSIIGKQYGPTEPSKGHWIADVTASYSLPSK
jgi:hypothetical protein